MEPNEKQHEKAKKAESLARGGSVGDNHGDNVCYEGLLRKEKIALKSADKLGNRLNWFYNIVFQMFPVALRVARGYCMHVFLVYFITMVTFSTFFTDHIASTFPTPTTQATTHGIASSYCSLALNYQCTWMGFNGIQTNATLIRT